METGDHRVAREGWDPACRPSRRALLLAGQGPGLSPLLPLCLGALSSGLEYVLPEPFWGQGREQHETKKAHLKSSDGLSLAREAVVGIGHGRTEFPCTLLEDSNLGTTGMGWRRGHGPRTPRCPGSRVPFYTRCSGHRKLCPDREHPGPEGTHVVLLLLTLSCVPLSLTLPISKIQLPSVNAGFGLEVSSSGAPF